MYISNRFNSINRYKNIQIASIYICILLYIAIQPIVRVLNYIGINISIKKPIIVSFFMLLYVLVSLLLKDKNIIKRYWKPTLILLIIILIYIFAYSYVKEYGSVLIQQDEGFEISTSKNVYINFIKDNLVYYVLFALIGININHLEEYMKKKSIKKINNFLYVSLILSFLILCYVKKIGLTSTMFNADLDNGYYLYIGDSFALFSIFIFKSIKNKELFLLNSLFWLYKIGSRTALVCFIIFFIVNFIITFISRGCLLKMNLMKYLIIIPAVVFILGFNDGINLDSRMLSVFNIQLIENDNSYTSRDIINEENINDLKNIWLTGKVFRELELHGRYGFYSHNILSYWMQFGIIPFILIIFNIIILVFRIIKDILRDNYKEIELITGWTIFLLPEVLFSRSYTYPYIWMLIFFTISIKYSSKFKKNYS